MKQVKRSQTSPSKYVPQHHQMAEGKKTQVPVKKIPSPFKCGTPGY